jgi:hypothetical protein
MKANGACAILLQVGWALAWAPPLHSWSRPADHMDSQARCLLAAKLTSCWASESVKISSWEMAEVMTGLCPAAGRGRGNGAEKVARRV